MAANIRLEGYEALLRKVKDLKQLRVVKAGVKAAALHVKGRVAEYPARQSLTRASVYGQTFQTARQRRFFFWALANGVIDVPYRRGQSPQSEGFGRRGTIGAENHGRWKIETDNDGLTAVVGNNASYGPYLMDDQRQSLYAKKAGWKTVGAVAEEERERVLGILKYAVDRALEG